MKRYIRSNIQTLWPFMMYGEYEDGYSTTVGGYDEDDCMSRLIKIHDSGKHGDLIFYTGVNDDNYVDGERVDDIDASTSVQAGIGSGKRSVWYIGQYPDRNRVHFDGYKTYGFASEEEAQAAIDELYEIDYYVENYPGLRPMHKFEYSVYHD